MERLESCEGRVGVDGVLGVAGGWVRWASEGRSGDDMAPSLRRGLPEGETSPADCQGFSRVGDSVPDILDDAVDVCESSLGGDLVEGDRVFICCFDDRRDPLGASRTKLTDDFLRL